MTSGWIGVDFDGTLAVHSGIGLSLGAPVPVMVARVKAWLAEGTAVKIFTARVASSGLVSEDGTDDGGFADRQRALIEQWCVRHLGVVLPVTATKDFQMIELWDDRAIQVISNTGLTVAEALQAEADAR